ncbi:MAG: glycosyltransferase family A protein [bacterium]|nr:glycosyltransferase family A protein [bacterium]
MKASVILPTHNRAYILKDCLQHILNQSIPDYEVIVIDDASTDETPALISSLKSNNLLKHIKLEKQSGPYVARNIGIKEAKGELIILLDSDVLVHKDFVKDHVTIHQQHPNIILQGMMNYTKDVRKATFKFFYPNALYWGVLVSQNTSVKKEHFIKAGLFDESMGALIGYKDIEMGLRLKELGLKFMYAIKSCKAYHIDLPYGNKRLSEYINKNFERGRSAYFFVKKHGTKAERIARTQKILAKAKFLNTDKWVEKPSCMKFLENCIDSPIYPLFPLFRKAVKYHYRAKGIREAEMKK